MRLVAQRSNQVRGVYLRRNLDIKRGAWPLERVKSEAERLFQLSQEAYVRSTLPAEPDRVQAERLCVNMISEYYKLAKHT